MIYCHDLMEYCFTEVASMHGPTLEPDDSHTRARDLIDALNFQARLLTAV